MLHFRQRWGLASTNRLCRISSSTQRAESAAVGKRLYAPQLDWHQVAVVSARSKIVGAVVWHQCHHLIHQTESVSAMMPRLRPVDLVFYGGNKLAKSTCKGMFLCRPAVQSQFNQELQLKLELHHLPRCVTKGRCKSLWRRRPCALASCHHRRWLSGSSNLEER